jgi:glutamyl-tRNA synthetase
VADAAAFLAHPGAPPMAPKAAALLTPPARAMLGELAGILEATDFTAAAVDGALRACADARGIKLGQVAQPVRAALTGGTTSPGIDVTLAALGRAEAVARMRAAARDG